MGHVFGRGTHEVAAPLLSQVDMKHTLASDEAAPKKEEGAAAGAAPSAKGAEGVKAAAAAPAFGAFEVVVKTNKSNLGGPVNQRSGGKGGPG